MFRYMAFWDFALGPRMKNSLQRRAAKQRRKQVNLAERNARREQEEASGNR